MTMAQHDPFEEFFGEIADSLTRSYTSYTQICQASAPSSSSSSPAVRKARADFESSLTDLAHDLADLEKTVVVLEHNPAKFNLSAPEVQSRRERVTDLKLRLEEFRAKLQNDVLIDRVSATTTTSGGARWADSFEDEGGLGDRMDDEFLRGEEESQMLLLRQQDEMIDGVSNTVSILRGQSQRMGEELAYQETQMSLAEDIVDRLNHKVGGGMKKMNALFRENEGPISSCCIAVLTVVLIILLVILIAI